MNTNYTAQEVMSSQRVKHFFTLEEANSSLVLVRRIVADVVGYYDRLLEVHETVEALEASGRFGQVEDAREELVLTADKIIVIDKGDIAAEGTHAELIESSTIYQEIYDSQLGDGFTMS